MFIDFQFPDDGFRVLASDFSVFVYIYSCSKYTDDFPYLAALVTAIFEYIFFSTLLVRLFASMTCGIYNPLTALIGSLGYLIFVVGTSFNVSRATWALWYRDSVTTSDLLPGRSSSLDALWYSLGAMVTLFLLYVGYSQGAFVREAYLRVPVSQSIAEQTPRRAKICPWL
jgi:hypothetical protein